MPLKNSIFSKNGRFLQSFDLSSRAKADTSNLCRSYGVEAEVGSTHRMEPFRHRVPLRSRARPDLTNMLFEPISKLITNIIIVHLTQRFAFVYAFLKNAETWIK